MSGSPVVVTGASGDIGRATVSALQRAGRTPVGLDVRAADGVLAVDLTSADTVEAAFDEVVARHGAPVALINCAGRYDALDAEHTTVADFERIWSANVLTAWLASMAFSRRCAEGACVVNVASISGRHGSPDVAYGTAKAGVIGLTKSLALLFGPRIRVNAVSPGVVTGSMADRIPADRREAYRDGSVLGRLGTPTEVADLLVALVGPASAWMTGSIIDIDGGTV